MSLQVWLPMTEDLRQQGLSDVTVVNNGATFNSSGKLGGCYQFGTGDSYITIDPTPLKTFTEFSFVCWVKIISWNTSYSTIFAAKNGTSVSWNNLIFSLLRNSSNSTLCFNISNGSNYTTTNCQTGTLSLNTWYHITCTYKSGEIKLYQDGDVVSTYKTTVVPNFNSIVNLWIGKCNASSYQSNNLMNDVRIYDHCLSPMEVKRISQGLILHYPLNNMGFGQENLFKNSSLTDLTSSNLSTKIYYQGSYIPEITQDGLKFTWTGSSAREIDLWLDKTLKADTYYTLSFIYRNNMAIGSSFYLRKDGSLVGYWSQPTIPYSEDWSTYRCTFKIANYQSNDATTGTLLTLFYSGYTANKWIELKQNSIKLEEGSISTPWSPAPSDTLADTMGLNSNIEYDSSGYCHNGTKTGTFTYTTDSPKYSVSAEFDGVDSAIVPSIYSSTTRHSELTTAAWVKRTSDDANWHYYWHSQGISLDIRSYNSVNNYYNVNWTHATDSSSSGAGWVNNIMPLNTWVHDVWVFDHGVMKHYVNGELVGTNDRSSTGTYILGDVTGLMGGQTSTSNMWKGGLSDLRIYATALSATDIKSLYQNSATIDADGTIHGAIR